MMNEPQGRSVGPDELHDPLGPAATRALPAPPNDRHLARRLFGTGPEIDRQLMGSTELP